MSRLCWCCCAPYLVFIQRNGGVVTYFRTAAAWAQQDRGRAPVVWPGLFDNPDGVSPEAQAGSLVRRAVATVQDNSVAWLFYGELALPLLAFAFWSLSPHAFRPSWPNASPKVAAVAALALMLNVGLPPVPAGGASGGSLGAPRLVGAWLVVAALRLVWHPEDVRAPWRAHPASAPARALLVSAAGVVVAVLVIGVTDDLPRRLEKSALDQSIDAAVDRAAEIWRRAGQAFPIASDPPADPDDLLTLALYLRECTQPTDRIFVQHYIPQVLALGERGFAGGHADLRPGFFTTDEMQRLTVTRLRAQSVPIAIVGASDDLGGFRESFPIVVSYFDQAFLNTAEHTFGGRFRIRLLVNRNARATGRFEPLNWPCFRP